MQCELKLAVWWLRSLNAIFYLKGAYGKNSLAFSTLAVTYESF